MAFGLSSAVVESDLVAVGVGKGECPTRREGSSHEAHACRATEPREGDRSGPVRRVRMLAGMTESEQSGAFRILQSMVNSLRDGNGSA